MHGAVETEGARSSNKTAGGSNVILTAPFTRMEVEQQELFYATTMAALREGRRDGTLPAWMR
jgi:hypothetical protein